MVARYGGEEFIAILPSISYKDSFDLVTKVKNRIEELQIEHTNSSVSPYITMSFGAISGVIYGTKNSDKLLLLADEALHESKKNRKKPNYNLSLNTRQKMNLEQLNYFNQKLQTSTCQDSTCQKPRSLFCERHKTQKCNHSHS